MERRGIAPNGGGVYFGQLLGMADHLTFGLAAHGHTAYKYLPFGPLREVMPYLIRRAHENADLLGGGAAIERRLINKALVGRLFGRRA